MRRLILPLFLVLCSSGCGGCVGDDSSSSNKPTGNPGVARPGSIHMQLRPIAPGLLPIASAPASAAAPSGAPSAAPPPAPSGSAVP